MLAFWNSLETISAASTTVEITTAILGILLFIVERRETTLERQEDEARNLTDTQKRTLLDALQAGPKGPIHLNFLSGDAEAQRYAKQFQAVFEEAGFPVESFSWFIGGVPVREFSVSSDYVDTPPEHATTITKAFEAAGFSVHTDAHTNKAKTWVTVCIGGKPSTLPA